MLVDAVHSYLGHCLSLTRLRLLEWQLSLYLSRVGRWAVGWMKIKLSSLNNSKWYEIDLICQWGADRTPLSAVIMWFVTWNDDTVTERNRCMKQHTSDSCKLTLVPFLITGYRVRQDNTSLSAWWQMNCVTIQTYVLSLRSRALYPLGYHATICMSFLLFCWNCLQAYLSFLYILVSLSSLLLWYSLMFIRTQ